MGKIVVATNNEGKTKEIMNALKNLGYDLLSLADFQDAPVINEDGRTLEENSLKKAKAAFEYTKIPVIADDSGLEVMYLGGKPGVHSARYAGENATDEDNCKKLLSELVGVDGDDRKARFRCVITLYRRKDDHVMFEGKCQGHISYSPKGENGFGYDPVFIPSGYAQTFSELDFETKNLVSHRGKALSKLRSYLEKVPLAV